MKIKILLSGGLAALLLAAGHSQAQPPAHAAAAKGNAAKAEQIQQKSRETRGERSNYGTQSKQRNESLDLDERIIRNIFREQRHLLSPAPDALPPGIRKNLARGKPLPPGIAKQFDNRLIGQLPRYPDYDWRQVGRDAILVGVTTGVVEAILENIYD